MFVYFRHKRNHDDDKKESDKENMYRSSEWKERKKTIDLYNKNHAKTFDSIEFNGMNTSASRRWWTTSTISVIATIIISIVVIMIICWLESQVLTITGIITI